MHSFLNVVPVIRLELLQACERKRSRGSSGISEVFLCKEGLRLVGTWGRKGWTFSEVLYFCMFWF